MWSGLHGVHGWECQDRAEEVLETVRALDRDGSGREMQEADAGVDAGEWGDGVDAVEDDAG